MAISTMLRVEWRLERREPRAEVQVVGDTLRIRRDRVLEDMLRGLGARLTSIEASFDPEHGAYGHGQQHDHDDHGS